jgi:hypothetical protein
VRRTEHDLPITVTGIGSIVLALLIALFMPGLPPASRAACCLRY